MIKWIWGFRLQSCQWKDVAKILPFFLLWPPKNSQWRWWDAFLSKTTYQFYDELLANTQTADERRQSKKSIRWEKLKSLILTIQVLVASSSLCSSPSSTFTMSEVKSESINDDSRKPTVTTANSTNSSPQSKEKLDENGNIVHGIGSKHLEKLTQKNCRYVDYFWFFWTSCNDVIKWESTAYHL